LELAIAVASKAHEGQYRESGEPYITHCLAVALILAEMKMDSKTIAAGILHDAIEDTQITYDNIRDTFGVEVAKLVDGVTKMTGVENRPYFERQAINLRKTIQAMLDDVRVVIIKLADRLHNMRTLNSLASERKIRIAQETLDVFVPLAHRLGMWMVKNELEDLCFQHLYPNRFSEQIKRLEIQKPHIENLTRRIRKKIEKITNETGIQCNIIIRWKNLSSISPRITDQDNFNHLAEIISEYFIFVPTRSECYLMLGFIHEAFQPIIHEFEDYVATPKDNLYQSLHTKVMIPIDDKRRKCNIIIRTPEMDNLANHGIVSGWMFGNKEDGQSIYNAKVSWLRALIGWTREISDASDFISAVQSDLLKAHVYVLSPEGDTYELPKGATPLDFAYVIHTEVGHRCRGALIEGIGVPLTYKLRDGDQIKVLTAFKSEPKIEWLFEFLGLANTEKSRQAIKKYFKRQEKQYCIKAGRKLFNETYRRLQLGEFITKENLVKRFNLQNLEELHFRIGRTILDIENILETIAKDGLGRSASSISNQAGSNIIKGGGFHHIVMCSICKPQSDCQIVGLLKGKSIQVHCVNCTKILNTEAKGKLVDLEWGTSSNLTSWRIKIDVFDREGLLYDIFDILSNEGANVTYIFAKVLGEHTEIIVELGLLNLVKLNRLLVKLEYTHNVVSTRRVRS
jgi:GTP pyrophosphokinase